MLGYFRAMLERVDTSLLDEWEGMLDPELHPELAIGGGVFTAVALGGVYGFGDRPMREALDRLLARVTRRG